MAAASSERLKRGPLLFALDETVVVDASRREKGRVFFIFSTAAVAG